MKPSNEQTTEYWDLYRMDGRFVQVIPSRGYSIPEGMYHMAVEVIPTDKAGHMLITQRSFEKRIDAGKLEFPAGSVLTEEPPFMAARRELLEETGLKAKKLEKIGEFFEPRLHRTIYLAYVPDLLTADIQLQEGETIDYAIVTFSQWLEFIAQERFGTSKFRNYTPAILKKLEMGVGIPTVEEEKVAVMPRRLIQSNSDLSKYTFRSTESQEEQQKPSFEMLFSEMEE